MSDEIGLDYLPVDNFYFESLEQFEAFEDPLRFEMIRLLGQRPLTGAQIARSLGLTRHRVYYHLNLLEKHGLIVQVGERTRKGIVEKYYRSTARVYHDDDYVRSLRTENANTEEARRTARALRLLLAAQMKSIVKTMENGDVDIEFDSPTYNWDYTARLTPAQADIVSNLMKQVLDEVIKMDQRTGSANGGQPVYCYRGICTLVRVNEAPSEE